MASNRVLIIDNEDGTGSSLSDLFQDLGLTFNQAEDGKAGAEAAPAAEYDVILLDPSLSTLERLGVLRSLKEEKPEVPIVMITACTSMQSLVDAMKLGAHDYVTAEELRSLADVEREHIQHVLAQCDWNQTRAASILGIDRKTLRNKIREYRLGTKIAANHADHAARAPVQSRQEMPPGTSFEEARR